MSHRLKIKILKKELKKYYLDDEFSMSEIADKYSISRWLIKKYLDEYKISQRNRSECMQSMYKNHPLFNKGKNHWNYGNRGENTPNYKHGKTHNNRCECGNKMNFYSKKCKACTQFENITREFLIKEYIQNQNSAQKIALKIGCTHSTILNALKKFKIKSRSSPEAIKLHYIKYPMRKGKSHQSYKDGRSSNTFYCKNNCGRTINAYTALYKTGLCQSCFAKERFSKPENCNNYIDGRSYLPYPPEFTVRLKEEIRKRDKYICQNEECNMTEDEHLIVYGCALHIHHIDYNKKHSTKYNLISLCNQCNVRANFNRDFWKKYYTKIMEDKCLYIK